MEKKTGFFNNKWHHSSNVLKKVVLHKEKFQLNSETHLGLQQHRKMSFHRIHVWSDICLYQGTPHCALAAVNTEVVFTGHTNLQHLQSTVLRLSNHHKVSHSGKILKFCRSRKSTKASLKVSSQKNAENSQIIIPLHSGTHNRAE